MLKDEDQAEREPSNVQWALFYAQLGWAVLPVNYITPESTCSCCKAECSSPGKHPLTKHGFKDATTEPEQIRQWWEKWQDANIGIATGKVSKLVVMDEDPRNGSVQSVEKLEEEYGPIPHTLTVKTGGGGRHRYFSYPGHAVQSRPFMDGIDLKGDGGYVVAPPSNHISGECYQFNTEDVN